MDQGREVLKSAIESNGQDYSLQSGFSKSEDFESSILPSNCITQSLQEIKRFCEWLDIPFYAVRAQEEFRDQVLKAACVARIEGIYYNPCIDCQKLKVSILFDKAQTLGADYVATGHYAKVYNNQASGDCYVLSSNDLLDDQSTELSKLDQKYLEKLILPLSEMRKNDVKKIAKAFDGVLQFEKKKKKDCFYQHKNLIPYIESHIAPSLLKSGELINPIKDESYGEHLGTHLFYPLKKRLKLTSDKTLDNELMVFETDYHTGSIYALLSEDLTISYLYLEEVFFHHKQDFSVPLMVFFRFCDGESSYYACLYFKNNRCALLELSLPLDRVVAKGEDVIFYSRQGGAAKQIGRGVISEYGKFVGEALSAIAVEGEDELGEKTDDVRKDLSNEMKY